MSKTPSPLINQKSMEILVTIKRDITAARSKLQHLTNQALDLDKRIHDLTKTVRCAKAAADGAFSDYATGRIDSDKLADYEAQVATAQQDLTARQMISAKVAREIEVVRDEIKANQKRHRGAAENIYRQIVEIEAEELRAVAVPRLRRWYAVYRAATDGLGAYHNPTIQELLAGLFGEKTQLEWKHNINHTQEPPEVAASHGVDPDLLRQ